jgi:hypothetical protein
MSSLKLKNNSQNSHTPKTQVRPRPATSSNQSFLGGFSPNSGSGAALSIGNPQFGSRSSSAAGKLHIKSFLG